MLLGCQPGLDLVFDADPGTVAGTANLVYFMAEGDGDDDCTGAPDMGRRHTSLWMKVVKL